MIIKQFHWNGKLCCYPYILKLSIGLNRNCKDTSDACLMIKDGHPNHFARYLHTPNGHAPYSCFKRTTRNGS